MRQPVRGPSPAPPSPWRGTAARPTGPRPARVGPSTDRDGEAPVLEPPQGIGLVVDPEVLVEVPAALAPRQRLRGRDAVVHLGDAAFVHAVLGPRSGEVLDAGHLDVGHV